MTHSVLARKLRCRSGFSLVEVVFAAGILGFVLSVVILLFINAIALNGASRNLTVALSHAQYVLEDIRNAAFVNIPAQIDPPDSNWDWNTAAVNARGFTALKNEQIDTLCVNSSGAEITCSSSSVPLKVKVIVSWTEANGRAQSVEVTTEMEGA